MTPRGRTGGTQHAGAVRQESPRPGRRIGGRDRRRARDLLAAAVLALGAGGAAAGGAAAGPGGGTGPEGALGPTTAEILERFDLAQRQTTTLVARFTEEKHLRLLSRPRVSQGRFYFNRPNMVRWEYEDPERKVFVITEDRYVAYYPSEKKAEDVDIRKFVAKRLFRFLAVGQSSKDLEPYYSIARVVDGGTTGTYLLVLTPRRNRVRERLAVLRLFIDARSYLPRRVVYEEPNGDSTRLTFEETRTNVDLPERQFRVDLPSDVLISSTLNGLGRGLGGF